MSQERPSVPALVGSLLLALVAYGVGLVGMGFAQARLVGNLELRGVLILSELALALPAVLAAVFLSRTVPDLYRFRPLVPWGALKTVALGLALWALSLGVFEAQFVLVKPPIAYLEQFQGFHELLKPVGLSGWIFSIGAIAFAPAICEEIVFRGLLTPVFRKVAGPIVAIVISAGLFAAIHIDALRVGDAIVSVYYRVPFAFILGMLLAKIRLDTGSLWPPIIAHATLNATTFVVVLFAEEPTGVLPDPQPLVALGMLLAGSLVARVLMRQIQPKESALSA